MLFSVVESGFWEWENGGEGAGEWSAVFPFRTCRAPGLFRGSLRPPGTIASPSCTRSGGEHCLDVSYVVRPPHLGAQRGTRMRARGLTLTNTTYIVLPKSFQKRVATTAMRTLLGLFFLFLLVPDVGAQGLGQGTADAPVTEWPEADRDSMGSTPMRSTRTSTVAVDPARSGAWSRTRGTWSRSGTGRNIAARS